MAIWMPNFIDQQKRISNLTLEQFSQNLKDELESEMTAAEKQSGCIIHIAGYVEDN